MKKIKYNLEVEILTPLHISNGVEEGGYIDSYIVKEVKGKEKIPYIPASSIKGKVRDNFYTILNTYYGKDKAENITNSIFGSEGYNPSKIYFEDLRCEDNVKTSIRFGNAIDRYTKHTKDRALKCIEVLENGKFLGTVTVFLQDDLVEYKDYLEMAFKMIESLGGNKSRGLGRVKISLEKREADV
ncbi:RAMP superfamily CRISPR-associated protein [Thermobrachium celere]|uniref:RAMP superfamily CRISPR-associated protein n=1 Tax=Thermobrachium celere TaxID=53422 RepID=UPI001945512D|nr:RAMP superfamily CRISPR-associated protein [Thermobrachium celere]GFR35916.1 type III-A CRISPR-associated RAMP protein Csm3 [Thermobrachium celere]